MSDRPITNKVRSPFLVFDEQDPKIKDRSPLAPNTKHCDDSTGSDRPIAHQERSPLAPNTKHCDDSTSGDRPSHQIPNRYLRYNQGKTHDESFKN